MIDIATLFLTHGIMALALWRMLSRDDLDEEESGPAPRKPWHRPAKEALGEDLGEGRG